MPRSASKINRKSKVLRRAQGKSPGRSRRTVRWERVLIFLGLICLTFFGLHKYLYYRSLSLSRTQVAQVLSVVPKEAPLPVHIFIPWNTNADIEPLAFVNGQWAVSDTKVTYLLGSARPGENGNIIVYGHNKREILGNIRVLKGGEKITIRTSDGRDHVYVVQSGQEVSPKDIALLSPTSTEVLTLYTCSGIFDSQRFIVRAIPDLTH